MKVQLRYKIFFIFVFVLFYRLMDPQMVKRLNSTWLPYLNLAKIPG